MYLFAPSYVPSMSASHQPKMSGLSVPAMSPACTLGATTPVSFGAIGHLRTPVHKAPAPEIEPMLRAPRIDRYDRGT